MLVLLLAVVCSAQLPHYEPELEIPCRNIVPGLGNQQRGIDISTWGFLDANPKFSIEPLIKFTCNQFKAAIIGGISYEVPDQVSGVPRTVPSTQTQAFNWYSSNYYYYSQSISEQMDTSYLFGMFSKSTTYTNSITEINSKSTMIDFVTSEVSAYEVIYNTIEPDITTLELEPTFCGPYANTLPLVFDNSSFNQYENFFKQCGTHFINDAFYGGLFAYLSYTHTQFLEVMSVTSIQGQANAAFGNFLIQSGAESGQQVQLDQAYIDNTFSETFTRGGIGVPTSNSTFTQWAASVYNNPWIWNGTILPVTLLVPKNITNSTNAAIVNHLSIAFINNEVIPNAKIWQLQLTNISSGTTCTYSGDCDNNQTGINTCKAEMSAHTYNPPCCYYYDIYPHDELYCCCSKTVSTTLYYKAISSATQLLTQVNTMMDMAYDLSLTNVMNQTEVQQVGQLYTYISNIMQTQIIDASCTRTYYYGSQCGTYGISAVVVKPMNAPIGLINM